MARSEKQLPSCPRGQGKQIFSSFVVITLKKWRCRTRQECKNKQEYLNQIIEPARRACKRYGYLPSVLIAQSCLENGYGVPAYWDNPQIRALIGVNNMVGIKRELLNKSWVDVGLTVWDGTCINKLTPEVYGGVPTTVKADFRKYDTIERSFADYLCFMTWASNYGPGGEPKYGAKVLNEKDPETLIKRVSSLGYATGTTYASSVMRIVREHNLTQYDNLDGVQPSQYYPGKKEEVQTRNKKLTPYNHTAKKRSKNDIKWIVIHYVGALGGAKENAEYYATNKLNASADFFVGFNGEVWQGNDYYNYYSWHCGGGYQSSWTQNGGGKYYKQCTNANSIGIEMCVRKKNTKSQQATDTDWYFEEATINGAAQLVKQLMAELDIDINHVIMHYHVNRKICPNPFVIDINKWNDFLNRIQSGAAVKEPDWYRVRLSWDNEKSQIGAFEKLENAKANCPAGYTVYDVNGKAVYTNNAKPSSAKGYRVRVGIYMLQKNIDNIKKNIKKKLDLDCFQEKKADGVHVYCGSFDSEIEAKARKQLLNDAKFAAELEER